MAALKCSTAVVEGGGTTLSSNHNQVDASRRYIAPMFMLGLVLIHPVREIAEACRAAGVPLLIDASQSIAHIPINVREIACDYLVFSGHKIYGPGGTGVLYVNHQRLECLRPLLLGGSMVKEVHPHNFVLNDIPYRFEAGSPNIEGVIGLGAALTYCSRLGHERNRRLR